MNRFLIALLIILPMTGMAQSPEQQYLQGNEVYQQGNFPKAVELYESVLKNGYVSGDLYYNLGNAYYRSGNLASAIVNYERAQRIMPADDDVRHNLQIANSMITDKIERMPRLFVWDWWDAIKASFAVETATWLAYGVFLVFLTALGMLVLLRSYRLRIASLWATVVSVLVLGFSLAILFARISDSHRTDEAVVMSPIATVKNSPDEKSSDAFVLHAGLKVQMIDKVADWTQIRLADGKVGWIPENMLETI